MSSVALEKHELRRLKDMLTIGRFLTSDNMHVLYDDTLLNITTDFDKFEREGLILRVGKAKRLKDQRYIVSDAGLAVIREAAKTGASTFGGFVKDDGLLGPSPSPERRILRFLGLRPRSKMVDVVRGASVAGMAVNNAIRAGLVKKLDRDAGDARGLLILTDAGAAKDEALIDAEVEAERD